MQDRRVAFTTIQIGRKLSSYALLLYLEHYSVGVDSHCGMVLGKMEVATKAADKEVCVIPVSSLGFSMKTERPTVIARLEELGFTCCEPEVGPYLALHTRKEVIRRRNSNEPCGDVKLTVIMRPIEFDKNYKMHYIVECKAGEVFLRANNDMGKFDLFEPSDILVCQRAGQSAH